MRVIGAVVASLRPKQWVKNLFVFAGVIFSQQLFTPLIWPALGAFALFCALSGAMYLLNEVADAERARLRPSKPHRPVAAGALPRGGALAVGAGLLGASLAGAFAL